MSLSIRNLSSKRRWCIQHHAPAALLPGKTRYPLYTGLGGPRGRSGRHEKCRHTGIRPLDQSVARAILIRQSLPAYLEKGSK